MKSLFKQVFLVAALAMVCCFTAHAQSNSKNTEKQSSRSSNVAVIVVSSAAKAAWATTKFVAKDLVQPVAKAVFIKAAPRLTIYAIRKSPGLAKRALPMALKLALL